MCGELILWRVPLLHPCQTCASLEQYVLHPFEIYFEYLVSILVPRRIVNPIILYMLKLMLFCMYYQGHLFYEWCYQHFHINIYTISRREFNVICL